MTETAKRHGMFVSVVVPLTNAQAVVEEYVHQLSQLMQQHFQHYEIVLINNGSTNEIDANHHPAAANTARISRCMF